MKLTFYNTRPCSIPTQPHNIASTLRCCKDNDNLPGHNIQGT